MFFDSRCHRHKFVLSNISALYTFYRESALCKRTRLVESNVCKLGKGLQIVGSLEKYPVFRRQANTAKITERYRYDKCTRARDDKEDKPPIEPIGKDVIDNKQRR